MSNDEEEFSSEERAALERYYTRKANGTLVTVPHHEVVRRFEEGELSPDDN